MSMTDIIYCFLENVLGGCPDLEPEAAGLKSYVPLEQPERMIDLTILKYDQLRVTAFASWDSSMHDSVYLNRVTQNNERIYLILKVGKIMNFMKWCAKLIKLRVCLLLKVFLDSPMQKVSVSVSYMFKFHEIKYKAKI